MTTVIKTLLAVAEGITKDGAPIEVGETFQTNEKSAASLVKEGFAEYAEEEQTPREPDTNGPEQGEELENKRKALDDQYKKDDLAEEAKKVGVEFAYDAKKDVIIQAIIDQGKVDEILK